MQNLAGHDNPDPIVEAELFVAGIDVVRADVPRNGEVRTRITGRLGAITFTRAWYYWMTSGEVPLRAAQAMYERPYGRRDVRVAGHCGCPPPEPPWVRYRDAAGTPVVLLSKEDLKLVHRLRGNGEPLGEPMREIISGMLADNVCVETEEERDRLSAFAFIDSYHIDSQAGLKVFVDAMRAELSLTSP